LTGGIGDFIAIESFMSDTQRNSITQVFLATRAHKSIKAILEAAPIFPNLEKLVSLHDNWQKVFCVVSYDQLKSLSLTERWNIDFSIVPKNIIDYSIWFVFQEIKSGRRKYNPSNLFKHKLADISHFNLPSDYAFIQPYSPNDRQGGNRDFTKSEWNATLFRLKQLGLKGVVVLNSDDYVPNDPNLINLTNKTSVVEAIEIAKQCSEFIGVDSCFAALVCKFLPDSNITIKTVNEHYLLNQMIYCSPKTEFGFVCSDISKKW
jgi:hypothetical protein